MVFHNTHRRRAARTFAALLACVIATSCEERITTPEMAPHRTWQSIAIGGDHSCAIATSGNAYCWGRNHEESRFGPYVTGQLGDGETADKGRPSPVAGGRRFVRLTAGSQHTCGLTEDGQAFCWGYNSYGQLGAGVQLNIFPIAVETQLRFKDISAEGGITCALGTDGRVHCWGVGFGGRPAPLAADLSFASLHSGTCAITSAGDAYCWPFGAIGLVPGGHRFIQVAQQWDRFCGVTVDGALYCGTFAPSSIATLSLTRVKPELRFADVELGTSRGCALTDAGSLYCWEDPPASGEMVPGTIRFVQVDLGSRHACARSDAGNLYCWGPNGGNGQLGQGDGRPAQYPRLVVPPDAEPGPVSSIAAYVQIENPDPIIVHAVGDTVRLRATVRDSAGRIVPGAIVRYASTSPHRGVSTIDASGLVTAKVASGEHIVATSGAAADTVEFIVWQQVASIKIEPASATLRLGETRYVAALTYDRNGYVIGQSHMYDAFASLDTAVVRIDANGPFSASIRGVGVGVARLVARSEAFADTSTITVVP